MIFFSLEGFDPLITLVRLAVCAVARKAVWAMRVVTCAHKTFTAQIIYKAMVHARIHRPFEHLLRHGKQMLCCLTPEKIRMLWSFCVDRISFIF